MKYWQDYIRSSYEIVLAAEDKSKIYLNEELESYLVRLMATWFDKNDIPPETPVAILMLTAMQSQHYDKQEQLKFVGDICLFYDSFKIKQRKWPSMTYYKEMGTTAYGMAYLHSNNDIYEQMENNFATCSKILSNIKLL